MSTAVSGPNCSVAVQGLAMVCGDEILLVWLDSRRRVVSACSDPRERVHLHSCQAKRRAGKTVMMI